MHSFEKIAASFNLNSLQAEELTNELKELQKRFNPDNIQAFYPEFEKIASSFGIHDDQMEAFVELLYADPKFSNLVTFIIPSFYSIGGDRMQFEATYEQMMCDLHEELDQ
ncbi:hypothetical protein GCM10023345_10380 [Acinetobacter kookii]|uniref:Uncharacterized protein n=1 Tax=Acinetobacter kookii TaxID=1226327 RepID=A0A1G6H358_9GAMM|nr:hypothetical protein [Acinetobacter kookii]SDB88631.1 hypothetical protein SAMN05421732_101620 [Acinetobacter kookii]